ncbi:unnamed protein product [Linum trigynum]
MKVNNITEPHSRSMLQRRRYGHHKHWHHAAAVVSGCKVNFDAVNYMPLRRRCRAPYRPGTCCPAFMRVACRFTDEINDQTSNCAGEMFGHINRFYPKGWFYQNCGEGPLGLNCLQI